MFGIRTAEVDGPGGCRTACSGCSESGLRRWMDLGGSPRSVERLFGIQIAEVDGPVEV